MKNFNEYAHSIVRNVVECDKYRGIFSRNMYGHYLAYGGESDWVIFKSLEEAREFACEMHVPCVSCVLEGDVFEGATLYVELS